MTIRTSGCVLLVLLAAWSASGVAAAQDAYSLNEQLLGAVRAGDQAGVVRALDQGASIDSRNRIGDTALISACKKGLTPMARMLIARGANVNQADVQGITPLMAAAFDGNEEIVGLLLARHADVSAIDRVGKTAIEYASGKGHTGAVQQLLDAGIDVNAAYHNHLTALMWAAGYDQAQTVSMLLARGANRDLRDDRGMTAKDIAEQTGSSRAALVLSGK
jgi:ankyrin repeat protein